MFVGVMAKAWCAFLKDLARTFPANDYMSTEEGQAALRRVLLAFSAHQPQVTGLSRVSQLPVCLSIEANLILGRKGMRAEHFLCCRSATVRA